MLHVSVLCRLCLVSKAAPDLLGETDELLIFCFHHLNHDSLYEKCCLMIEHILVSICRIAKSLIPKLSDQHDHFRWLGPTH